MFSHVTLDMIQNISLFRDLSFREKQAIAPAVVRKTFEKNEVISTAGEPCEEIFLSLAEGLRFFGLP